MSREERIGGGEEKRVKECWIGTKDKCIRKVEVLDWPSPDWPGIVLAQGTTRDDHAMPCLQSLFSSLRPPANQSVVVVVESSERMK